jgi:hypothetical protein
VQFTGGTARAQQESQSVEPAVVPSENRRSENFVVSGPWANDVALAAEADRGRLARAWLGAPLARWKQPARIVTLQTGGGKLGSGATTFSLEGGFYVSANWRGTREQLLGNVAPHEVLHMVLADHFGHRLPCWYEEGACVTTESEYSQQFHRAKAVEYEKGDKFVPFTSLLTYATYPAELKPFYAQAHSVADWLLMQQGPRGYLAFGKEAFRSGKWSSGFREVYGIESTQAAEAQWQAWFAAGQPQLTKKTSWRFTDDEGWSPFARGNEQ